MARGLPKSYIKKYGVSKRAWREYRKAQGKSKSTRKTNKSRRIRTIRRTMARKKRRYSRKFTIPIAVVAPMAWKVSSAAKKLLNGNTNGAMKDLMWHFACIDSSGNFNMNALWTWAPVLIGAAVHKYVGGYPLNVNRYLKDVPLLRV